MTDDIDEQYRRAAADHPSRPSDAVRRAVLAHSAAVAAEQAAGGAPPPSPVRNVRRRWRPAAWGGLAAAGLAGLLLLPRLQELPNRSPAPRVAEAVIPPAALKSAEPAAPFASVAPVPAPRAAREDLAKSFDAAPMAAPPRLARPDLATPFDTAPLASPPSRAAISSAGAAANDANAALGQAKAQPDSAMNYAAALLQAAAGGDLAGLGTLLDEGADAESRDAAGRTALLLAVMQGHADVVDLLLARGADPNTGDTRGQRPLAAAIAAHRLDIAAALRRAGAR